MPLNSVSIVSSTATGASPPLSLNWRGGKPAAVMVTVSSSLAVGDWQLQFTYSDISNPQSIANTSVYPPAGTVAALPSSVAYWTSLSTFPYTTVGGSSTANSGAHFTSSVLWPDAWNYTFVCPPAAVRLFSTTVSSHAITLTAIQGDIS